MKLYGTKNYHNRLNDDTITSKAKFKPANDLSRLNNKLRESSLLLLKHCPESLSKYHEAANTKKEMINCNYAKTKRWFAIDHDSNNNHSNNISITNTKN